MLNCLPDKVYEVCLALNKITKYNINAYSSTHTYTHTYVPDLRGKLLPLSQH